MSVTTVPGANFQTSLAVPVQIERQSVEPSLGQLFGDLSRETSELLREEIQLAKAELASKAAGVGRYAGLVAGGVAVAITGCLVLTAALVCGLAAAGVPVWISALKVGLIYCIGGGLLAWQGVSGLRRVDPVPHETLDSLKESGQCIEKNLSR